MVTKIELIPVTVSLILSIYIGFHLIYFVPYFVTNFLMRFFTFFQFQFFFILGVISFYRVCSTSPGEALNNIVVDRES